MQVFYAACGDAAPAKSDFFNAYVGARKPHWHSLSNDDIKGSVQIFYYSSVSISTCRISARSSLAHAVAQLLNFYFL